MAAVSIRFTQETSMVEIPETINLIPKEVFMNTYLPHVVGEVMGLKPNPDYSAYCGEPTARTGCMFQCFDGLGALLHEKLVASGCIHLPTWILPKLVVEKNSSGTTKYECVQKLELILMHMSSNLGI
ncbi:PREDICTED: uncharacterized protein LOC106339749 [Brassica oleracea var. oleracea]|uniref:uncharacterized protein LOC106339749 n=1 Tax=Brassica oleracea var. oleracea TaxID=109376 RepID=UPI0006A6BAFF|nr:PREDICTED: uncharacterized protein LOC106339749 [Brassica oleracea var. oleracea]